MWPFPPTQRIGTTDDTLRRVNLDLTTRGTVMGQQIARQGRRIHAQREQIRRLKAENRSIRQELREAILLNVAYEHEKATPVPIRPAQDGQSTARTPTAEVPRHSH